MEPEIIKELYEYFYFKTLYKPYTLDLLRERNSKFVTNFLINLDKFVSLETVGVNLLIDYFSYSFAYYSSLDTQRDISLNWIIGKKMIKRFFGEKTGGWDYHVDNFLREHQISKDEIRSKLVVQEEKSYLKVHPSEESEKSRVPDTEARIYNCLNYTTLFNHRSIICLTCHQKIFCRQILKKTNPDLYAKRGY